MLLFLRPIVLSTFAGSPCVIPARRRYGEIHIRFRERKEGRGEGEQGRSQKNRATRRPELKKTGEEVPDLKKTRGGGAGVGAHGYRRGRYVLPPLVARP
jgi:hypothetical protein